MNEELKNIDDLPQPQEELVDNQTDTQEDMVDTQTSEPKEDIQEKNMRAMRLAKEKAERERDEMLMYMRQNYTPEHPKRQEVEEQLEQELNPDDLVEWKHVSKEIKKLKDELKNYKQEYSNTNAETKLKTQYPDFDKVVSHENIETLRYMHPEIAQTLSESSNLYGKAVSAYTVIKNLGIYKEDKYMSDKSKAQTNAHKPRPLASVGTQQGDSPLSRANAFAEGLTDDLKKQLRKEMAEAIKRR